jgi:acetoin utilization protein AcuB
MHVPSVSRYMTQQPWTIARSAALHEAHSLMREHAIRHLPVVDNGELVGVVSLGDLHLLETLDTSALDEAQVGDAMQARPFIVTSDTALDDVVEIMANGKYGSAIVMGHQGVEGIFTMVDACRALADVLRKSVEASLKS